MPHRSLTERLFFWGQPKVGNLGWPQKTIFASQPKGLRPLGTPPSEAVPPDLPSEGVFASRLRFDGIARLGCDDGGNFERGMVMDV